MLKNILSLLLSKFYSKQESEAVGHQALPASSYTTLFTNKTITSWGAVASGVAANDGYLKLQSNGSGSTTAALMVMTPRLTSVIQYPFETAGISAWVPIAKGETWKVQGSDSTSINLYLYKTIGGGYKLLKKYSLLGGGQCLNSLSSSLRRSSCRINVRLSRRGITRRIPEPDYSLLQGRTTILSLPPTALSRLFCAKILKGSALVLSRKGEATAKNAQELMRQTYLDGTRHSSLFKKASESNFHPRFSAPLQDVSFCLTKPNLTVGGASC